jgi:hypothetical protein
MILVNSATNKKHYYYYVLLHKQEVKRQDVAYIGPGSTIDVISRLSYPPTTCCPYIPCILHVAEQAVADRRYRADQWQCHGSHHEDAEATRTTALATSELVPKTASIDRLPFL